METKSGWLMAKGNKYLYVQIGKSFFRLYHDFDIKDASELKDILSTETVCLLKDDSRKV